MKKQMQKLALAKETVRDLTGQDLRGAAGGTGQTGHPWTAISLLFSFYCE